jgi:alpha-mannosidase
MLTLSDEIVKGSTLHKNLAVTDEYLLLFGNGDGGGGPTGPMLDKLDRLSALSTHNAEVPDVKMGSPIEFFEKLMESTDNGQKLPTWRGELYFEYHRGVSEPD